VDKETGVLRGKKRARLVATKTFGRIGERQQNPRGNEGNGAEHSRSRGGVTHFRVTTPVRWGCMRFSPTNQGNDTPCNKRWLPGGSRIHRQKNEGRGGTRQGMDQVKTPREETFTPAQSQGLKKTGGEAKRKRAG